MKKYRLVIADDEFYIRIRIKNIIDWNNLPIELVGEAENGQQVIDFLKTDVDIVLLDIKMPGINGIEVAEYINTNRLATKIIILSGFNDFAYAQKCIRYGVVDYLLKPVDQKTLNNTLIKTLTLLNKENQEKNSFFEDIQIRNLLYSRALNDSSAKTDFFGKYITLDCKTSQFLGLYSYNNLKPLLEALTKFLEDNAVIFQSIKINNNCACVQIFYSSKNNLDWDSVLTRLIKGQQSVASIGNVFACSDNWLNQLSSVQDILLERYFSGTDRLYFPKNHSEDNYAKKILELRYQLTTSVNKGSFDSFSDKLINAKEEIFLQKSVSILKLFINEIAATLNLLFPTDSTSKGTILMEISEQLNALYNLDNLFSYIIEYFRENINETSSQPHDIILAEKISTFIDANFKNPKVNVTLISDIMGITASYAGIIFKRINNLSINQYLNKVRVEKACRLIEEGSLKISDIGIHVGYNDVFYFSRRFKSIVGFSPKEYQKAHLSTLNFSNYKTTAD